MEPNLLNATTNYLFSNNTNTNILYNYQLKADNVHLVHYDAYGTMLDSKEVRYDAATKNNFSKRAENKIVFAINDRKY